MQKLRRCGAMLLALAVTFTSLQLGSIKAYASEELPLDEAFTASSGMSTEEVAEEDLEKDTEEIGAENENGGVEAGNDAALSDLPENNNDQEKEQNEGNTADPQDENSKNENASDPETITITFDANGGLFPDGKTLSVIDAYKGQGLSTLPMNPEQKDSSFVFSGWYLEKNTETVVDLTTFTADEDITLYAGYSETAEVSEEEENTLVSEQGGFTLHANGGLFTKYETLNETYHVNYITRTLSSYIPVREGFVFTGWYKEPQCINKLSSDSNKYNLKEDPLEGSTIYAGWTNDTCTLTFVFDGESAPYNTGYYWDSEKKERLTTVKYVVQKNVKLTREDYPSTSYIRNSDYRYKYSSWYKDPARTQRVTVGTSYTPTEDTTFYKGYTDSNWVVTLKSADETGYFTQECEDYYEEDGIFDSMACQVNKPSGSATSQTWTLPVTSTNIKNSDVTKKIDGWYYDKDCTQPVNTDDNGNAVITGDTTIYIKWISAYKVITFDANGGYFYNYSTKTRTSGNLTEAIMTSKKKKYGDLDHYVKNDDLHYVFKGWATSKSSSTVAYGHENTSGNMSFSAAFDPAKDITLYAVWERKYSVVTLDANGGKIYDSDTDQYVDTFSFKYEEGKTADASEYIPKLEGKTFGGWYKDRACTDPVKTSYGNSELIVSGDVTVYAKWLNEYKVTFDYGEGKKGSASSSSFFIAEGSTLRKSGYTELINPTPNDINKAFVGWFLDESFENKVERNDIMDMVIANNVTFYAKYANAYTITFNANGGSFASASATYTYSVKIAEGESLKGKYPTVRSTDNKVFRGWFKDPEGNEEVVDIYSFKVTGNITLYAGYTECYILTFKANMAGAKLDGQTNDVKVKVTKGIAYRHGNESADKDKLFSAPVLDYSGITVDDKLPVFYYNGSNNVPAWSTNEEGTGRLYYFDTGHHMYTEVNAQGVTERFIYNMYGFVPTGDMTFYAKWADVVYVTFDANGGTFKENTSYDRYGTLSADKTQRVQKVAKGIDADDITKPYFDTINPPQDDYNQLSWYKDKSGKEYFSGIVTKDITVYAKYTKNSSGGSGSGSGTSPKLTLHSMEGYFDTISKKTSEMNYTVSSTNAYNSRIPIIDDEEKAFSGWYYDEERKNPYPAKYQIYRNGNWYIVVPKAVSDLYAGYGQTYTVTLNANGGYFDHDSDRVRDPMEDMREEAVLSEKASPAGYGIKISEYTKRIRRDGNKIFAGWYYDKEGTQKAVCTATDSSYEYYKPIENTTLFAKWIDYELPTNVEVGATALTLNIGEKKQLSATVLPESAATSQDVHWYVNSTGYNSKENPYYIPPVILGTDGSVTGQAAGTANVYAEVDGVRSDNVIITVSAKSVGQSISLNTTAINMVKNETATVTATVVPDTQANTVTWSSSKTSVATVTGNGATAVITAGSEAGEATITASFGKLKASVKVTVSVPITLDKNELVLTSREGVVAKLKATLAGDGVEGKPVTWESSDPEAVVVEPDPQDGSIGILTPAANLDETTTVTVTASVTKDAEHVYRDACVVTVNPVAGVEAPTASIAPGTVKAGTKVQLSSATYQADIYYTTDGSEPTEESALYTDAIVVSENVTIKAAAFKAGLRPSIVKEFAYVVETSDWGELSETAKTLFADSSKVPTGIWYCIKGYGADPNMCRMFTESGKTDHTETYTGNAITFGESIEVYFGTQKLVENRDYTLKFANNKVVAKADAGKKAPSVTITGKGNYAKKAVFNFTIVQADIADAVVISDPTTLITAGPKAKLTNVKPTFAFNGKKLALNKDYTLAYKNKDTGMVEDPAAETIDKDEVFYVYAVAKENSNFKGEMRPINSAVVIGADAGDISVKKLKAVNEKGKAISIPYGEIESFIDLLTIFDNRGEGATPKAFIRDGKKDLVYDRDYQIEPVEGDDYKSAGTHSFRISCNRVLTPEEKEAGEKRYLGQKVLSFTIAGNAMKSAKIAGLSTKVEFTGKAIELSDLFNDKDKTVVNYNKTAADDEKWTGVTLYLFDRKSGKYTVLKENTDYVVSMKNNGNPGKFTLTFTGIGGWTGAIRRTVTVKAYDMKKDVRGVIDVSTKTPSFVKTGAKPAVTVKYVTERNEDGSIKTARLLREGVDYTVTYKNNTKIVPNETELNKLKASARPTVTVKGKGNYAGANATATFCITKAPVTNLHVVAKDVIYNEKGKNGYFLVKPQLCDDGKAVSAGKGKDVEAIAKDAYTYIYDEDATMADGSIKYAGSAVAATDKPVDGAVIRVSLTVKCSDKSAYTADANGTEISGVYRVIGAGRNVSKYTVKVINPEVLTYTGGDEIIPIKDTDLEVSYKVKGEKNPIKLRPSDYEIVSIKNNRFIGKATITIAGKGIYGGTKTISAKVGARILK